MTDIIIQGIGGRMGHVLCEMIAQRADCRVIAGIDLKDGDDRLALSFSASIMEGMEK